MRRTGYRWPKTLRLLVLERGILGTVIPDKSHHLPILEYTRELAMEQGGEKRGLAWLP